MNQFKHALGSIKVRHNKNTMDSQTVIMDDPDYVYIPMSQHIGAPCTVQVKKGDQVKIGQVIGDSDAFLSVPIHASISGTVEEIREERNMMGAYTKEVVIKSDHKKEVWEGIKPPAVTSHEEFVKAIRACGLVGLGGASFPTFVKYDPKNLAEVKTLIVNGAECEPFITSDYRLMLENTKDIINGIKLVLKYLDMDKAYIGVEDNKPKAISKLREMISQENMSDRIEVSVLKSRYPQGAERVMIYELTGKLLGAGTLPAEAGVIVSNITTVASVSSYFETGMPLVNKRLTIDGTAIKNPQNLIVPLGTKIADAIAFTGGYKNEPKKVIMGGPMMGRTVNTDQTPIVKNNNAILAFSGPEADVQKETACIGCGKCHAACPFHLLPAAYYAAYKVHNVEKMKNLKIMQCMECGSCSYVCPARRPLSFVNKLGKAEVKEASAK